MEECDKRMLRLSDSMSDVLEQIRFLDGVVFGSCALVPSLRNVFSDKVLNSHLFCSLQLRR